MKDKMRKVSYSLMFLDGMKRVVKEPLAPRMGEHRVLNLGCGTDRIDGALNLDLPDWDGNQGVIRNEGQALYPSDYADFIYASHFLEHLDDPIQMLKECQRVLSVGGVLQTVVPFGTCDMALHDLTHKHFFTIDTWKTLFDTTYYDTSAGTGFEWKFDIHLNIVMGIKADNLALFTQFIKR